MIGARGRSFGRWLQRNTPSVIFLGVQAVVNFVGLFGLAKFTNPISETITRIVIANEQEHVKSGAKFRVMGVEQAGKEENIIADGRHKEQQANVKAKIKGVEQAKEHHHTMATVHEKLQTEAGKAQEAAERALSSTQQATRAVTEFTQAEEKVSQAYTALQKALNALDVVQVTHEAKTDHIQAVHSACLDIIVAEENLKAKLEVREMQHISALSQSDSKNTANLDASRRQQKSDLQQRGEKFQAKIEMGAIQHQSDLAQEYKNKLAERNQELRTLLAGQSIETLDKLTHMTTAKLKEQHAVIKELEANDDFAGIEQCQAHIEHLQNFLATTEGVMDDKLKEQVMEMKAEDNVEEEKVLETIPSDNNTSAISSASIQNAADQFRKPKVTEPYNTGSKLFENETHQAASIIVRH